jgi:hypothetical protein
VNFLGTLPKYNSHVPQRLLVRVEVEVFALCVVDLENS